jgi:hypothetical protein
VRSNFGVLSYLKDGTWKSCMVVVVVCREVHRMVKLWIRMVGRHASSVICLRVKKEE